MEAETIKSLEKTPISNEGQKNAETTGCCGGASVSNEEACCKLDENKKAEGKSGCGCNTRQFIVPARVVADRRYSHNFF